MFSNEAVWIFQCAAPCYLEAVELETAASAALCHPVAAPALWSLHTAPSPQPGLVGVVRGLHEGV